MATHAWDTGNKDRDRTAFDELTEIAHRVQTFSNASALTIGLRVGNTDEIICCARSGPKAEDVGAIMEIAAPFAQLCIQSGKGLLCEDTETDARVDLAAVRALGIRSIVVSPVKRDNQVVAILAVFGPIANAFTGIHLAVMKTSADQVAAFLHKTQQKPESDHQPAPSLAPVAVPKPPVSVAEPKHPPAPVQPLAVTPAPPAAPISSAPAEAPISAIPTAAAISAVPAAAPISAVPVTAKPVTATRAVEPPPAAVAATESKTPVREVPQRAVEPPAASWSGPPAIPAHPVFTPAPRSKPVTTVLAEEVRPSVQDIKPAVLLPAREERGGKSKQNRAIFTTLNSIAVQNKKPRSKMMIVSAAVFAVVAAGAAFAFVKARHAAPPVVTQRVQEALNQPAPALASASPATNTSNTESSPSAAAAVAPGTNNAVPKPPAAAASAPPVANNVAPAASAPNNSVDNSKKPGKTEAKTSSPQPEKAAPETVALASGTSKITPAMTADNGQQDPGTAPTLAVGGNAALGKLSGLSGSSTSAKPAVMTQSKIEPAQVITRVNPIYPIIAKTGGISNQDVVVLAHVGKDGKVASMRYVSGHPMLRDSAFAAVKQWQFKPATLNGQPIEQDQEIRFKSSK